MEEKAFSAYQDFIKELKLPIPHPELDIFVLDLSKIATPVVKQLQFFRNDFYDILIAPDQHRGVQFYADQMALTPKQLNKLTKSVLNKTTLRVIQAATVTRAKALILQSNYTLTEIAYHLGFYELSNFSRLFKRIVGQSPKQYREQGQN